MRSGARLKITLNETSLVPCRESEPPGELSPKHASAKRESCGLQPLERLHDGLPDARGGRPAERADLRGVELDQRRVAGPAADPAGVLEHRVDAEVRADRRNRLVDGDRLVGAEVVDLQAGL